MQVLLVGHQAVELYELEGLMEACAAACPLGMAPGWAVLACQVAKGGALLGLSLADVAVRPADCVASERQIECGLADQACARNASSYTTSSVFLQLSLHAVYPGPALSNPNPSLNLAAPEPLFLKSI